MPSDQKVANAEEGVGQSGSLAKSKDTIGMEESMTTEDSDEIEVVDYSSVSFLRKGFNQNIVAGIVAFTGPGLFNAMQGLGHAGGSDPTVRECFHENQWQLSIIRHLIFLCITIIVYFIFQVAAKMNATLYATFAIFGVLSGSFFNILGTKLLMSFGALTYAFYAISVYLWGQVDDSFAPMAITASALLGLGAACLWGAQGTMTLSYALENQKRFILWTVLAHFQHG